MVKIKDIPILERPRERLINNGVSVLSNEELLSILLKTGIKNMSVKELSNYVLKEIESFTDLNNICYERLICIKGIGSAKACELLAAIELGKRLRFNVSTINQMVVKSSCDIYNYYKDVLRNKKQEHFYCVYLDAKNKVIKTKLLFVGTINQSLVHPREIFKEAYLSSASSIICIHNHPSGNVNPSNNDKEITKQLSKVSNLLGINFLDHIIVGEEEYYSFSENGMI